jgi:hypothetical protein
MTSNSIVLAPINIPSIDKEDKGQQEENTAIQGELPSIDTLIEDKPISFGKLIQESGHNILYAIFSYTKKIGRPSMNTNSKYNRFKIPDINSIRNNFIDIIPEYRIKHWFKDNCISGIEKNKTTYNKVFNEGLIASYCNIFQGTASDFIPYQNSQKVLNYLQEKNSTEYKIIYVLHTRPAISEKRRGQKRTPYKAVFITNIIYKIPNK